MEAIQINMRYSVGGEVKDYKEGNSDVAVQLKSKGDSITLSVAPVAPIKFEKVELILPYQFNDDDKFFVNGFQSWTLAKEFAREEVERSIKKYLVKIHKKLGSFWAGDQGFYEYSNKAGIFHSFSYTYIKAETNEATKNNINVNKANNCAKAEVNSAEASNNASDKAAVNSANCNNASDKTEVNSTNCNNAVDKSVKQNNYKFFGSLNESVGYTIFEGDFNKNQIKIIKDVEGVTFDKQTTLIDVAIFEGGYQQIFDNYFKKLEVKPISAPQIKGYTSWYNYYSRISEKVVLDDLENISKYKDNINLFQIDDGYQTAVGDWLSVDSKKFPNGMKVIADSIHQKGLSAGIWVAPFSAQKSSQILREHPDWFICEAGVPKVVGANWGGFCALDIYNENARAYIKHCFDVILNDWGYDLVKLDFCYAVGVVPRNNKSRSALMFEAVDFLRECVGEKRILGCGIPLAPAFGKMEYMRIGADMRLQWGEPWVDKFSHKEDCSTLKAVYNSIYRRHLNRAFQNDPDVLLLRDYNINFTFSQQKLLAKLLKIFGQVLLTSDDVGSYGEEQEKMFLDFVTDSKIVVNGVTEKHSIFVVDYTQDGVDKTLKFNLLTGEEL
ncbi:MAG: alpha-galactosidase [Clostridia bacterium]